MASALPGTLATEVGLGGLLFALSAGGFPGTVGVNSDFRDWEEELALKTGPLDESHWRNGFQLSPGPWCSPGAVTGVEFLQPGPPESAQTA